MTPQPPHQGENGPVVILAGGAATRHSRSNAVCSLAAPFGKTWLTKFFNIDSTSGTLAPREGLVARARQDRNAVAASIEGWVRISSGRNNHSLSLAVSKNNA